MKSPKKMWRGLLPLPLSRAGKKQLMLEEFQKRWGGYKGLAIHYFWENLWWDFVQGKAEWLREEIRM